MNVAEAAVRRLLEDDEPLDWEPDPADPDDALPKISPSYAHKMQMVYGKPRKVGDRMEWEKWFEYEDDIVRGHSVQLTFSVKQDNPDDWRESLAVYRGVLVAYTSTTPIARELSTAIYMYATNLAEELEKLPKTAGWEEIAKVILEFHEWLNKANVEAMLDH